MAEERYTLDTSAVIAYFANEAGADTVEGILVAADRRRAEVYASFMTYMELLYRVWKRLGEKEGKAAYLRLRTLAVRRLDVTEGLLLTASRIKAADDLSVADAWIAQLPPSPGANLFTRIQNLDPSGQSFRC